MAMASRRSLATTTSPTSAPSDPQPARAILNPRKDESGNEMRVSFSPRAAHRLATIASTDSNPNLALRITIESGGCHGFQYLMQLADLSKSPATEEDTVFEGDKGAKAVIDEASLELLNGSTVDYTMELIGSQFKVTGIPGATSSCGCGTSFDIKL
jgi:iron-sulfur cluster assembly accessory protein